MRGSFVCADEVDRAVDLLAEGALEVDGPSHVSPLHASLDAFDALRSASTLKVLISSGE